MSPVKFTVVTLAIILTYGFGAATVAQENKTSSEQVKTPTIQKSSKEVRRTPKQDPPQQKCQYWPNC